MKKKSGRVTDVIALFNAYINNTEAYLRAVPAPSPGAAAAAPAPVANYVRLGLTAAEMEEWTAFRNQWNALYPKYSDKEESRTTAIRNKLRGVQKAFKLFARKMLAIMAASRLANDDDAAVLNFVLHRAEPVRPVAPIDNTPVFGMFPVGGGEVKFSVRAFTDTKRASKIFGAEVEVRYKVQLLEAEEIPGHVNELPNSFISTKAIFLLNCGTNTTEKVLYAAVRWVDMSDPSRNGPWTAIQHTAIV